MQRCELDSLYSLSSLAPSSSFGLGRLTASNTSASLRTIGTTNGTSSTAAQVFSNVPSSASVYTNLSFVDRDDCDGSGSVGSGESENEDGNGGGEGLELEPDEDVLWHTSATHALLPHRGDRNSDTHGAQRSGRSRRANYHRAGASTCTVEQNGHSAADGARAPRAKTAACESEQRLLESVSSEAAVAGQHEYANTRTTTRVRHERAHSGPMRDAVRCRLEREHEMEEEAALISVPFGLFDVVRNRDDT